MYLPKHKTGSIFIVGNSEEKHDISHFIKEEDVVVRFNLPNITSSLIADILFIANSSDMVSGNNYISAFCLKENTIVIWRYSVSDMIFSRYQPVSLSRKLKYSFRFHLFKKKNRLNSFRQVYFPRDMQQICEDILGNMASTGFLAVYMFVNLYPSRKIYLHNFTFSGWSGHSWKAEKKYIDELVNSKKINLLE
ncbi:hypothetical protein [Ignatzschineria sp. LJL83]